MSETVNALTSELLNVLAGVNVIDALSEPVDVGDRIVAPKNVPSEAAAVRKLKNTLILALSFGLRVLPFSSLGKAHVRVRDFVKSIKIGFVWVPNANAAGASAVFTSPPS